MMTVFPIDFPIDFTTTTVVVGMAFPVIFSIEFTTTTEPTPIGGCLGCGSSAIVWVIKWALNRASKALL